MRQLVRTRFLAIAVTVAMAFAGVPFASVSAYAAESNAPSKDSVKAQVEELLSSGDYEKGEAIAVVKGGSRAAESIVAAQGADVEIIFAADSKDYEEYVALDASGEEGAKEAEEVAATLANAKTVSIIHITNKDKTTKQLLMELLSDDNVLKAEPNRVYEISADSDSSQGAAAGAAANASAPAKDATSYQWGYSNDGTLFSMPGKKAQSGFDVNLSSWNKYEADGTAKKNAVGVVAILDTGIDYEHPDLKNVVMSDMRKYNDEGGNYGYYPVGKAHEEPMDLNSHGTHCAGIIAAEWNNEGVSGIANGCKLVSVKISIGSTGSISDAAAIKGYKYLLDAAKNGLELVAINNSWGGEYSSDAFNFAASKLGMEGAITLFSAGNSSWNMDVRPDTVNSMSHNPYVVAVNSATSAGQASPFTNYGKVTTDVFAPGSDIYSTVPRSFSTSLVEADKNPIFHGGFHDGEDLIIGPCMDEEHFPAWWSNDDAPDEIVKWVRSENAGLENGDSAQIQMNDLQFDGDTCDVIAYLPVDADRVRDIQSLSLAFVTDKGVLYAVPWVLVHDSAQGKNRWTLMRKTYHVADSSSWSQGSFSFSEKMYSDGYTADDLVYLTKDDSGKVLLPVRISLNVDPGNEPETIYLDQIGLHSADALQPYSYKSGTSMATPVVTGAAAVVAKEQRDRGTDIFKGDKEAAARERANILKGRVRYVDEFAGMCRQGGMLDLSVTKCTPVLNNSNNEGNLLLINGAFFGEERGTVTLDGTTEMTVSDWNDNQVTVEIPADLKASSYTISITNGNGLTGKNYFEITGGDDSGIFERDVPLEYADKEHREHLDEARVFSCNGKLYVAYCDVVDNDGYSQLWSYDPSISADEHPWKRCADLPKKNAGLNYVDMLETKEGLLTYVTWYVPKGAQSNGYYKSALYLYDANADKFTALTCTDEDEAAASSLVAIGDQVFLVGGYDVSKGFDGAYANHGPSSIMHLHVDVAKKTWSATAMCELEVPGSGTVNVGWPSVSAAGNDLYIGSLDQADKGKCVMLKATLKNNSFTFTDLSEALPKFDKETLSGASISVQALKSGVLVMGMYQNKPLVGTFFLGNNESAFQPYSKEIYPAYLHVVDSCQMGGYLYAVGRLQSQTGTPLVIRGTKVDQPEKPVPSLVNASGISSKVVAATAAADGSVTKTCTYCSKTLVKQTTKKIKSVDLAKPARTQSGVPCYQYTGKAIKPAVTVKDAAGKTVSAQYYTVTYSNNTKIGKATCKVTFKGLYSGAVSKTFYVVPKAPAKGSVKKVSSTKKLVKWAKVSQASGYQIRYKTGKTIKYKTVKRASTVKTTLTKLKKGKKYRVSVRAYKTVSGKKYYSKYRTCK